MKVSVIIPTYNRSSCIQRAVDSVLNQTLDEIEVIVVDDNGIDTEEGNLTFSKMLKYKDDVRVKYIRHKTNLNGSVARNNGIKNAKGKYIAFLDDDDEYFPLRLEHLFFKMESLDESWGACYSSYIKIMKNGTIQKSNEKEYGDVYIKTLMRSLYIGSGSNLFVRRSVIDSIGMWDETFRRNQDLEFMIRIFKKYKLAYVDEILMRANYDVRNKRLSFKDNYQRELQFRNKFSSFLSDLPDRYKREVSIMYDIDLIRMCIGYRRFIQAICIMIRSKIPLKIYYQYIKYALDRKRNRTCYGFRFE